MRILLTTEQFDIWFGNLKDLQTRSRVLARMRRAELGNLGDWKPVGGGVSEMRIHCGPGIRIYFIEREREVIVLLAGGDKSTQEGDITCARILARALRPDPASG